MELPPKTPASSKTERLDARRPADILRAAAILRAGGTVAFPTETVYGLGANALDPVAVAKIFAAKQRPSWDPLIVHIGDRFLLNHITVRAHDDPANILIATFWPGPLTLLLPRTPAIPDSVTAGRPLVGVRMPSHPVALELLAAAGIPIAAPSANTFGHTSPTTAAHVLADLDGRIDAILDGGPTTVGIESTVLDPAPAPMLIYRPGAVTPAMIELAIGKGKVQYYVPPPAPPDQRATLDLASAPVDPAPPYWTPSSEDPTSSPPLEAPGDTTPPSLPEMLSLPDPSAHPASLPSPGVGIRHYAPRARLLLIEEDTPLPKSGSASVGIMLPTGWAYPANVTTYDWGRWTDYETLARRLFSGLRALDDQGVEIILCPLPPAAAPGSAAAIRDRLQKAAKP